MDLTLCPLKRDETMQPAIFLDRDGVINEVKTDRVKYVNHPDDLHLLPDVGEAIKLFNDAGWKVFVVTNQGGIGLGFMEEANVETIHRKMEDDLAGFGAWIEAVRCCPHKPHANCACRKPKPKMITDLAVEYDVDVTKSYMVGDRKPDIEAGRRAGTYTVLVGNSDKNDVEADFYFSDLLAFGKWLCEK